MLRRVAALALAVMLLLCGMGSLAEVLKLPEGLLEIGDEAFRNDTSLDQVVLPEGLTKIGAYAFAGSSIKRIYVPRSVNYLGEWAFDRYTDLIVETYSKSLVYDHLYYGYGYRVVGEKTHWVQDSPAWVETEAYRDVYLCSCGLHFETYSEWLDHVNDNNAAAREGREQTLGGKGECGAYTFTRMLVPLQTPIHHEAEGHYETVYELKSKL